MLNECKTILEVEMVRKSLSISLFFLNCDGARGGENLCATNAKQLRNSHQQLHALAWHNGTKLYNKTQQLIALKQLHRAHQRPEQTMTMQCMTMTSNPTKELNRI